MMLQRPAGVLVLDMAGESSRLSIWGFNMGKILLPILALVHCVILPVGALSPSVKIT